MTGNKYPLYSEVAQELTRKELQKIWTRIC
nr:MAG TPA: hypothetical protein [Caudoviricetes sp.]